MATVQDVIALVNGYHQGVQAMLSSESIDETKDILQKMINLTEATRSPGNSYQYLADIDDALVDLMLNLGTRETPAYMEELESAWQRWFAYLKGHWWQFGADESRVALFELPPAPVFS